MKKVENQIRSMAGTHRHVFWKRLKKSWQLHLLLLIPVLYLVLFHYWPMFGAQIAFRNFRISDGIMGSEWVGLKWFKRFLGLYQFKRVFTNTLVLALYSIVVGFPLPILFALFLNIIENKKLQKFTQTISYIPHFISVTVLVSIIQLVCSPISGIYGSIFRLFGGEGYPYDFVSMEGAFRHIYVWSDVWQQIGWNAIIYTAALSAVPHELHEAAMIDGASRWKRVIHVDFPTILPTAGIMLIMRCGSVLSVGFEKAYQLQTSLNLNTSEVIATYVYKAGMGSTSDYSYGAAVGLFNAVINCTTLVLVNWVSKKISENEVSLF